MKNFLGLFLFVLTAGLGSAAMAQDATPVPAAAGSTVGAAGVVDPRVTLINQRLMEQGARIKDGVKSGTLTKESAKPLWQQVKAIQAQKKADIQQNGKKELTDTQLTQLVQMLDDSSKAIYAAKHAGTTPSATPGADSDSDASN
jgi:hypothetical protein